MKVISVLVLLLILHSLLISASTKIDLDAERSRVVELFQHGYSSYMKYAFPMDELKPLSCSGHNTIGNYSLTLIDTLDMLPMLGEMEEFEKQVKWVQQHLQFDLDVNVSTFETNIRILGGLLSSHLFAEEFLTEYPWGDKSLLDLSIEIGDILMKAFDTPTGIPYGTVNLAKGGSVPINETFDTSVATAGTFTLEFGLLSRLTKNPKYSDAANEAVEAVWQRRSAKNLLGNHIDISNGRWAALASSIGGNSDSYYEYLLKSAILFGNEEHRTIFLQAYNAILQNMHKHPWYVGVDMNSGTISQAEFESLQGFWPGLQTMVNDVHLAADTMHVFHSVWQTFGFSPEVFNLATKSLTYGRSQYPLRPEMAESLYYLYTATKDPIWLQYGRDIINSLETYAKVPCGFAAIENVDTFKLRDHMDSFFLSETCKYLYLLFTPNHFIQLDKYVFTTEAHPIPIRFEWFEQQSKQDLFGNCGHNRFTQFDFGSFQSRKYHYFMHDDLNALNSMNFTNDENDENVSDSPDNTMNDKPKYEEVTQHTKRVGGTKKSKSSPSVVLETLDLTRLIIVRVLEPRTHEGSEEFAFLALFGPEMLKSPVTGEVVLPPEDNLTACMGDIPVQIMTGKIAAVMRGTCEFVVKVRHCQQAGAIGVLIIDHIPKEDPLSISLIGDGDDITIPSALLSYEYGQILLSLSRDDRHPFVVTLTQDNLDQKKFAKSFDSSSHVINLNDFVNDESISDTKEKIEAIMLSLGLAAKGEVLEQLLEAVMLTRAHQEDDHNVEDVRLFNHQDHNTIIGKQPYNSSDD